MVEQSAPQDQNQPKVVLKYFEIDTENSFAQFSSTMSEARYGALLGKEEQQVDHNIGKGKMLIQCLDRSGSMSGRPMSALHEGALHLGKTIIDAEIKPFQRFLTITYDNQLAEMETDNWDTYEKFIKGTFARSMTNFKICFDRILEVIAADDSITDLTVIFFTDGADTCNKKPDLDYALNFMKEMIRSRADMQSKFLSLGFSANHDAVFMNEIAQVGNDLGNFIFIDTREADYPEKVKESLSDSLAIAMEGNAPVKLEVLNETFAFEKLFKTEFNYEYVEENLEDMEEEKEPVVDKIVISVQTILQTSLLEGHNIKANFEVNKVRQLCQLEREEIKDPAEDIRLKARVKLINQKMFDFIQHIQKQNIDERKASYEVIKEMDRNLDVYSESCMKIKDKQIRKEMMEEVLDTKQKVIKVMDVLRQAANGQINNAMIAQLNDVAYKAIRKGGQQKKLDERALKNETLYKKLEQQLKALGAKLDEPALRQMHAKLIEQIGNCPLSQNDVLETMIDGDCMAISLQISRSEACIMDPSKLIIHGIVPTFMSLESFMDSSIFNLKKNQDASGGFDYKKQGELAIGLGRESVTGALPLFLFKEHWEFARRKIQPLLGFMCCLDPMGYAASQYFIIPFLVLQKAIEDHEEKNSESTAFVLSLVQDTCTKMVAANDALKQEILQKFTGFVSTPQSRTADVIDSIPVLTAQLLSWMELSAEERQVKNIDPQAAVEEVKEIEGTHKQKFARFAIEEGLRRRQKRDAQPLSKMQILKLLFPDIEKFREETLHARKKEFSEKDSSSSVDKYSAYSMIAEELRKKDKIENPVEEKKEEVIDSEMISENKETDGVSGQTDKIDYTKLTAGVVASKPWIKNLENAQSKVSTLVDSAIAHFDKVGNSQLLLLNQLLEKVHKSCSELLGDDRELILAILVQNCLHPKNSQRVEAVKAGTYKEIQTVEEAREYLSTLLQTNLHTELMSVETEVMAQFQKLQQAEDVKLVLEAPDVYIAAAILNSQAFYLGKGDRTAFFDVVLTSDPKTVPDLGRKLKLVTAKEFMGLKLYNDKLCMPDLIKQGTIYKLWLHCVRKFGAVTIEQMEAFAPNHLAALHLWHKFVDAEGKTTLCMEEYMEYRKVKAVEAEKKKKQKKAKKGKKGKL